MIISRMSEYIGNTPMLKIPLPRNVSLFLKLEMFNPTGSMKDRMALSMLDDLERRHKLKPGAHIVESSSGNTASALSLLCRERGYKFTAVVDDHAAEDKLRLITTYGGLIHKVGESGGKLSTMIRDREAERLASEGSNTFWTAQHNNPANAAGYELLAEEIVLQVGTVIDAFISAIGTGGSLCGTASYLKKRVPSVHVVGVEPSGSVIFGWPAHEYLQSGTGTPAGANVGLVIDYDAIDEGRKVGDAEAFAMCRVLADKIGLLVGGSAGGAIYQALMYAETARVGATIVSLACDSGTKYLDTIFDDRWLTAHNIETTDFERRICEIIDAGRQAVSERRLRMPPKNRPPRLPRRGASRQKTRLPPWQPIRHS